MNRRDIEAIYPLSPQQQGILLDALGHAEPGRYIEQETHRWPGTLDQTVFDQAWQAIVDRHGIFRTVFLWRDQPSPVQVVFSRLAFSVAYHDLSDLSPTTQLDRLQAYRAADRVRGFDLSSAPLLRVAVFRISADEHHIVVTHHHIAIDGWSLPIIYRELVQGYDAIRAGHAPALGPAGHYRDYVSWLRKQDVHAAEAYWREALRGVRHPTPLGRVDGAVAAPVVTPGHGDDQIILDAGVTAALQALVRQHRVTVSALVHAAWAVVLARYSGDTNVVFGTTVSGRPPELPAVEQTVGLFINTLPFRIQVSPERPLAPWLEEIQRAHLDLRRFEYCSTGQVHQWSDVPGALPLYESIVVFENYPSLKRAPPSAGDGHGNGRPPGDHRSFSSGDGHFDGARTRYALTLLAAVADELLIRCTYQRARFAQAAVANVLRHCGGVLRAIAAAGLDQRVADLLVTVPEREIPVIAGEPAAARTRSAAAGTPVEELLLGIWADVLGLRDITLDDDFLALGGHSLLATQMMSRIRELFEVELPLRALFEARTGRALARRIETAQRQSQEMRAPAIVPTARNRDLPVSYAQERLWILDQLAPGNTAYNVPVDLRLRGALDLVALQQALDALVARHESLRTTFAAVNGTPVQIVNPHGCALAHVDLTTVPEHGRDAEAARVAQEEVARPFDLAAGPLFRALLLQQADDDHLLVMTLHHIISDGWSIKVLLRELWTLYDAFRAGASPALEPLPIQYADFAAWQREWLQGERLERQLTYWKTQLENGAASLELPADRPRPPVQSFHGAQEKRVLSAPLSASLRDLSRSQGVTLFMTLLGGLDVLLGRYAGQEDVFVGSPIAGRNRLETEGLIGFFLNTLVMRTDLSGDPTFEALLARVRRTALDAYAHQDLPFERLVQELLPQRDLSRTPFFQVFFNMLNYAEGPTGGSVAGLRVDAFMPVEGGSRFDLTLYAGERDETIELLLVYNPDLFDAARMAELLRQYEHLLQQVVRNRRARLSTLSLVTDAARPLLPDPAHPLDDEWMGAVHALFEQQARRRPDHAAVIDEDESWTYAELDARSTHLAQALVRGGLARGDVVAIYAHRSAPVVWALLGVLKAGGAFLLLDPAYPALRVIEYLTLARPKVWLHVTAAGALPPELETFVSASAWTFRGAIGPRRDAEDTWAPAREPLPAPAVTVGPDDLACLSFTSGSTGQPKAVLGRHGPLSHFMPWIQRRFGLTAHDRFSMLSGLSHDPLQRDIFTPLCTGGTIVIPRADDVLSPGYLPAWAAERRITVAHLTPAMGRLLAQTASESQTIDSLRYAFFVGDVLTRTDVAGLQRIARTATIVNYYGSTETQRAVGHHVLPACMEASAAMRERIPAGTGIVDVQLLVLTPGGALAGVGELGEIHVRSPHLARGYLDDPASSTAKFLSNPISDDARDRLYRTGDLGRYLPDGDVEFARRADHQVKVRGFRIELDEVEGLLRQHPDVRDTIVVAEETSPGQTRLVAYLVAQPARTPGIESLRGFLGRRLPEYMIPSTFLCADAIPLTPNGKVDRAALGAAGASVVAPRRYAAPGTALHAELAHIWRDVLGVERVGIDDGFFALGGHSLLASQAISRIRQQLRIDLPLRSLFEHSTIASLAEYIGRVEPAVSAPAGIPKLARDRFQRVVRPPAPRRHR